MSSPVEEIEVLCPACGETYSDWYRASFNLELDDVDEDYLEEASTATCPKCRHKVEIGTLIVSWDGTRAAE